jgi:hypothetical protein
VVEAIFGRNITVFYLKFIEGSSAKPGYLKLWPKFGVTFVCVDKVFNYTVKMKISHATV